MFIEIDVPWIGISYLPNLSFTESDALLQHDKKKKQKLILFKRKGWASVENVIMNSFEQ